MKHKSWNAPCYFYVLFYFYMDLQFFETVPFQCLQCTLSRGSLYEVIFSDIIIIITIMITIICLFAAVVPPMEGTTDSVHFGQNKVVKLRRKIFPLVRPKCCLKLLFKCLDGHNSTLGGPICKSRDIFGILMKRGFSQAQTIHDFTKNLNKNSV